MILSQDLVVTYKWREEPVLKGITGEFNRKILVLGPNGAGKTTFFRAICGLTNILSGKIEIDGANVNDLYATTNLLATNFQEVFTLIGTNVYDTIKLYTDLGNGDAQAALDMIIGMGIPVQLLHKNKINELSSGQQKIVCSALALALKAKYVLLDEPFENLDPAKKGKMVKHLAEYEGVVIVNTHETWLLKNLQEWDVFFMFEGQLYGPMTVKDLLEAKIVFQEIPEALLSFKVNGKSVSILAQEEQGTLLASLENLDKIYDLAEEA